MSKTKEKKRKKNVLADQVNDAVNLEGTARDAIFAKIINDAPEALPDELYYLALAHNYVVPKEKEKK